MSTHVVKTLEHAKLLTDPFKLKLLEYFSGKPVTTKQVADDMGEKAPKLYRHVDAMVEAGFLQLVAEKPKRGTVERYYRAVASRFEIDPELFAPSASAADDAFEVVRSLLRETESDLLKLATNSEQRADQGMPAEGEMPLVLRFSIQAGSKEIASLRRKLDEWLAEVQQLTDSTGSSKPAADEASYAGMLAFYPSADCVDVVHREASNGASGDGVDGNT